jgi:maltose alpha-D-glucosyltransferase/alpha-amylase
MAGLGPPLQGWLPARRWFGGKGRPIAAVKVSDAVPLDNGAAAPLLALVEVGYADGPAERYFVPLRPRASGPLGGFDDALADESACLALLDAVADARCLTTAAGGRVRFSPGPAGDLLEQARAKRTARTLGAEQSNTSIVFGDIVVMKCFRRVPVGPNPDLEVVRFLATRTSFGAIPRLVGTIEYDRPGADGSLAILQEFVRSEGDGWSTILRALAAGDFAPGGRCLTALRSLGVVTADLHRALASDRTDPDFAPQPVAARDLAAWRASVVERVERATRTLQAARDRIAGPLATQADAILAGQQALVRQVEGRFDLPPGALAKARFHGDYHLGQVLKCGDHWVVLDFEGEPLRSLAERRAKGCSLKDVAGMLRSFSYAHQAALREPGGVGPPPAAEALEAWEQAARTDFLRAYFAQAGPDAPFLPADQAVAERLLGAFELEKAAYELEYELRNRPDWVAIPLTALASAVQAK